MMMAEAYLLKGNLEQGNAEIQKALDLTVDKPELHSSLLAAAGAVFEGVNDFVSAEARYKESLQALPNQFLANFGLGKMLYNRAVDKIKQADLIPPEDYENGEYEKLDNESKDLMRQSIPYFINAIQFIDNLDAEGQGANRSNLYHCLTALNIVYARLEMYEELKPIKARIEELKKYAECRFDDFVDIYLNKSAVFISIASAVLNSCFRLSIFACSTLLSLIVCLMFLSFLLTL